MSVRLSSTGHGPTWLEVRVAHRIVATAELGLEDAAVLRDGLTFLLHAAGPS
ncbi:hypothetical protein [Actinoplanes rectilineatus]|uniref:hypothetical protein n=1 Tax=Actinoplanes rectilineatus TaxID=113571 RepID=UPI0012F8F381|nr:hypothetical protein [Actinoplanes rectilineatus]